MYAGFNAAGPNVKFGAGLTDHNNPANFSIVPGTAITSWTNPNLGRSCAFGINVLPSSSAIEDIVLQPAVPFPTEIDAAVLSTAATGTSVGTLVALNEFDNTVTGAGFTLVVGAGDTNNPMYSIGGPSGEQLLVDASLAGLDDVVHSVRVLADAGDDSFERILTFTVKLDSDSDNLIDDWETMFGLLSDFASGGDHDADGLDDEIEFTRGTNPNAPDSDSDGSLDGDEIANGTDPADADTDGDGLNDGDEASLGSNPLVQDTDDDGITDGDEVSDTNGSITNPTKADTDDDGFDDGFEIANGFSPTDPNSRPSLPVSLGVGTVALLGGDLTDPENDGDPEADVNYDAIFESSEEPGFGGGESSYNVFDNLVGGGNDKWCCGDGVFPYWIQATFEQPIVLTHFTVAAANDTPERDPRVWEIQGSNDGITFDTIFRQDDPAAALWGPRLEVLQFTSGANYNAPAPYSTIRFICFATGLTSGAKYQVGEIEFFGITDVRPFLISEISYDPGSDTISITWPSREGETYTLLYDHDLTGFQNDLDDGIEADAGDTTTFTFPNPDPASARLFFVVRKN